MRKWHVFALLLSIMCGFAFVAAALTSRGWDLRPTGGDLSSIVSERARSAQLRQEQVAKLQRDIERLNAQAGDKNVKAETDRIKEFAPAAAMTAVKGSGIEVTLDDAPRFVEVPGLDPNLLVVHQQDIQAVVNAMWKGGAEAITIQGQRLSANTGIKCVGNTVILNGVPYSPPYVIEAIGPQNRMSNALASSPEVSTYIEYADRYGLVFDQRFRSSIKAPSAENVSKLSHARVVG